MLSLANKTTSLLRGGGCGSVKISPHTDENLKSDNQAIQNFINRYNYFVEKICTKAAVAANQSESQEIMIAIQWFIFQEEYIYKLIKNCQNVKKSYNLILDGIRKLMKSCLIYIRTDYFKCLYILQTTASLSKVIFSFHIMNEERFMKYELQKEFLDISDELKQQMEIEKNDLIHIQMELYLFLTKTSFEMAPNNSNEREDILKGCLSGVIGSIMQMKPNAELLESLFKGALLAYKMYAVSKNRKQYEVYFQIDMLQWEIINYFKNEKEKNLVEIIEKIQTIHEQLVKNSINWKTHFLWIQMIGKILIYNPMLTKQKLYQLTSQFNLGASSRQMWKEYQNKGLLIQMNHSNDQAVILLNQLQNKELLQLDRVILEDCFKEWENFLLLKDYFLNEKNPNIYFTFQSYLQIKLKIGSIEPQKDENILIGKILTFFDFIISNKLLTLIKENYEKLGVIIKNYRAFMKKNTQLTEKIQQKIYHVQINQIIQNFKEYLQNIQKIIKIIRLNLWKQHFQIQQFKQKQIVQFNNLQQLKYLMKMLEQILQLLIQDFKDRMNEQQKDQSLNQNDETAEREELWRQKEFVQDQLSKLELETKISQLENLKKKLLALPAATLSQPKFLEAAQSLIQFITNSWKQLEKVENSLLQQNNHISFFEYQLNNLYIYYETINQELKNDNNESKLFFKEIIPIKYEIEALPKTGDLNKIKLAFSDRSLVQYIQNLRFKHLKLHLNLDTFKKSFLNILKQTNLQELSKLQEFINFDEFLISVLQHQLFKFIRKNFFPKKKLTHGFNFNFSFLIENEGINFAVFQNNITNLFFHQINWFCERIFKDFPKRIIKCDSDLDKFTSAELKSVQFNEQDYYNNLSKQKGLIECLQFHLSIEEQTIAQEELDLELIQKEFGELFIEESHSYKYMVSIIESLPIEKLQKNVNEEKFNLSELRLQKEKFENFLIELGKIQDLSKYSNINQREIDHLNQLATQTNVVIKTLQTFENIDKDFFFMLMSEELTILQSLLSEYKLQSEDYQSTILQYQQELKEKEYQLVNNKTNQNEEKQKETDQNQEDDRAVVEKNGEKFKFYMKENCMTKLQQQKIKEEKEILNKLLEEINIFSNKLNQIQRYQQQIQTKFQQKFQDRFSELTKNFEQLTMTKFDLQQKEEENFELYFERISSNLSKGAKDTEMSKKQTNISDFLNSLKSYCLAKLSKKRYILNTTIEQEFMIEQVKKLYLQDNEVEEYDEKSNQKLGVFDTLNQSLKDFNNNEEWKIKQGLVFTLIQISSNCFTDTIISFCQKTLIKLWVSEKDQRVRNLLKNKNLINMQMQILKKDWQTQHDRIAGEMQQMLKRIDQLQEEISHEANLNKRDLQLKELDETTQQLDEYIGNISEMGQQLRLITDFVNHIRKGLLRVEGKINEMKEQLNSMGNDIKFLRGKSVEQLLEIRKWKVLKEAAYKNVKSIYVPLKTQDQGKKEQSNLMSLDQFDNEGGEVNEFLQQEKTVILIHGIAGSGKSTTAKKIEEFIWKQHENNKKIGNQVLIPIYISLPSLKNPVFQAVEETLLSDDYGFDALQLKECKEKLEKKEFRFLLIMDSYDEMKLENIQKNLYINNKVKQNWSDPLVIFTTRSEIFTSINYIDWFAPEEKTKFKEMQLLNFDKEQTKEYLKKFTMQSIKMLIFEIYEWQIQIKKGCMDINKFEMCWGQLQSLFLKFDGSKQKSEALLNQKQIESILVFLKDNEFFVLKSNEALRSLSINLQKLWSIEKYEKMMKQINLNRFVETPYMMEIIVQVLPQMMNKANEITKMKENFINNFSKMINKFLKSKYLSYLYKWQFKKHQIKLTNEIEKFQQDISDFQEEQLQVIVKKKYKEKYKIVQSLVMREKFQISKPPSKNHIFSHSFLIKLSQKYREFLSFY